MRIKLDRPRSGKDILHAFRESFPKEKEKPTGWWQLTGKPHQIEFEAVDNLMVPHTYRSWEASPMRLARIADNGNQWIHDPSWGEIKGISVMPLREDKMYEEICFFLEGVDPAQEGRRPDAVKRKITEVVQKFHETLICLPAAQAA